ncbi:hypothetical protein BSF38_04970 [Paludisphaera borealis]|uniref:Alcohol dehydrogenase-like N-terminal domain-containing protein n=1 Tax=Paludisphaera borealis TaxID=1387353 RepID=A0A1U7CWZ1_9BACT|nr:hypothetical protein BSF38_04970 [Paludisphaera borealis]
MTDEALWYRRFGPPIDALTLEAAELGARPPGTVRVRMITAPINPSDLIPITGAYGHRVRPPQVAGYEGVGQVVEADHVSAHLVGRRALPLRGPGTWRRYVDCDPSWLVEVPDDLETSVAARAYINPLAALRMLETWPVEGRRVVLTAGGSSCARLLGRWALEAGAREVVVVCRSVSHAASLAELGLIPLSMAEPHAIAAAASRADVAFDAVGGPLAEALLAVMPRTSDFVSYGLLSGESFQPIPTGPKLQRFHLRDRLGTVKPLEWQGWFRKLWPMLRRASLPEARSYPLSDWRQAITAFDEPGRRFKPMLALDDAR